MASNVRSYVGGNLALDLEGTKCGFLKGIDGGAVTADVITEAVGADYFVRKHIGGPKYEDITLEIGFSMAKPIFSWIADSWEMKLQRKKGSIIACDYKLQAQTQRDFFDAMIVETVIPALDGASKEAGYIKVKLSPETIRTAKASGKIEGGAKQKIFVASNFSLDIPGLDCKRVSKIDSFTVKQSVAAERVGELRDMEKEPGRIEFPNLKITFSETSAQSWRDWFEDFVVKGNSGEDKEKNGTLTFLSPNRQDKLASINLFNLGIFRLADATPGGADAIHRVSAELYCERMQFVPGSGA